MPLHSIWDDRHCSRSLLVCESSALGILFFVMRAIYCLGPTIHGLSSTNHPSNCQVRCATNRPSGESRHCGRALPTHSSATTTVVDPDHHCGQLVFATDLDTVEAMPFIINA